MSTGEDVSRYFEVGAIVQSFTQGIQQEALEGR